MNFYSFDDINAAACCLRFAREVLPALGYEIRQNRIQAKWRGGDGFNVALDEHGWFDHKTKDKGGVISLCALTKFGGAGAGETQQAQDFLGEWLGLSPRIVPRRRAYDYTQSLRYKELAALGYSETRRYVYTDAAGLPCHYTIRMEHPAREKRFFQCTPFAPTLKDADLHLYNLPSLAASDWAVVVEGEKDADTLIAWGLPATTCNNGADNWRDSYTEELRGKDVIVCRDNDPAGADHAHLVLRALADAARSLRVVCPSALPKGDVTDWAQKEGGDRDRFLALAKSAPLVPPEEARWSDEEFALHKAKEANRTPFANFTVTETVRNGRTVKTDIPRPVNDLINDIHVRLIGFPKRIGDFTLFDLDRDTGRVEIIRTRDDLFAWIGQKSRRCVEWRSINGAVSKGELFSGLLRSAARYEKTSAIPDFPMRSDVYYTFREKLRPTAGHEAFKAFLACFAPDGEASAVMLAAFIAAPMFFRKGFQRPCWIIDSREGRGVGKTTLVSLVSELYGCSPIRTSRSELERNEQELLKRIVSVSGRDSRIILLDNLKGEFDNSQWADLVTAPSISGRAPYGHGEDARPNDLTFVITSNYANIGSDVASRAFMVFLKRRPSSAGWEDAVIARINAHRMEILGDIYDILATSAAPEDLRTFTRVPDFERSVVFPMCGGDPARFAAVMADTIAARENANVDSERAREAVDAVRDGLRKAVADFDPDSGVAFIRTAVLSFWLKNLKIDAQDVWNMVNTREIECFHRDIKAFPGRASHPLHARGILWIGPNAAPASPFSVPILRLTGDRSVVLADRVDSNRLKNRLAAEGWFARAQSVVDADGDDDDAPVSRPAALPRPEPAGESLADTNPFDLPPNIGAF